MQLLRCHESFHEMVVVYQPQLVKLDMFDELPLTGSQAELF